MRPLIPKKTIKKRLKQIGVGCLIAFCLIAISLCIFQLIILILNGSIAIENASAKYVKTQAGQDHLHSEIIGNDKAVAFIGYNCRPINRITKGIQRCKGQYFIYLNKINDIWVVNESSKTVIW